MLETLTRGFKSARERLAGVRELSETNVDEALRDVRTSLLEADVDFSVAKDFLARVKQRGLGEKVETRVKTADGHVLSVTPGQHFVAACQRRAGRADGSRRLVAREGCVGVQSRSCCSACRASARRPSPRSSRGISQKQGRRPLLVAADVQRPAAVQQLQQLGAAIDVPVHARRRRGRPGAICARGARAREAGGLRRGRLRHRRPARDRRGADAGARGDRRRGQPRKRCWSATR